MWQFTFATVELDRLMMESLQKLSRDDVPHLFSKELEDRLWQITLFCQWSEVFIGSLTLENIFEIRINIKFLFFRNIFPHEVCLHLSETQAFEKYYQTSS